jgi:hypothetical protein
MSDIKYGEKDLLDGDPFDPSQGFISMDIFNKVRDENAKLREAAREALRFYNDEENYPVEKPHPMSVLRQLLGEKE